MWTITLVGVILCDKGILLERELSYTLKSANKQLTHAFLHFVASLQRKFYTLAPISVLYVNIYPPSLRLFKTDSNPWTMFNFSDVFAVKLASRYICFKYLVALKELFFRPVTWRKYIGLTSLWFCRDIAKNTDFRQRSLCLLEVVDKIMLFTPNTDKIT